MGSRAKRSPRGQSKVVLPEIKKGKKRWEKEGFGLGTVLLVENRLVILSDRGELVIADANHYKFQELARFQVLSGKENWTPHLCQWQNALQKQPGKWVCLKMGGDSTVIRNEDAD